MTKAINSTVYIEHISWISHKIDAFLFSLLGDVAALNYK